MFSRDNVKYEALPLPDRHNMSDDEMAAASHSYYDFMCKRHTVRDFSDRAVPISVIEHCVHTAGTAPSGANHQPWHFVVISNPDFKRRIRVAAEEEERRFYAGGAGDEWLKALEPIGTSDDKPHLEQAPWLIIVFAQRYGQYDDGTRFKN
jgi:nitroreductase